MRLDSDCTCLTCDHYLFHEDLDDNIPPDMQMVWCDQGFYSIVRCTLVREGCGYWDGVVELSTCIQDQRVYIN